MRCGQINPSLGLIKYPYPYPYVIVWCVHLCNYVYLPVPAQCPIILVRYRDGALKENIRKPGTCPERHRVHGAWQYKWPWYGMTATAEGKRIMCYCGETRRNKLENERKSAPLNHRLLSTLPWLWLQLLRVHQSVDRLVMCNINSRLINSWQNKFPSSGNRRKIPWSRSASAHVVRWLKANAHVIFSP